MKIQKPLLTISLIISNRPDTIPRCLDSLRPIMEAIPSELILIDTSKSEEIHKMLLEYTDQVYEFEWCQDFAKARNEGVRRANGKWFLYLDDDEWFAECDELIKFFKSGKYKKYGSANIKVRNFSNPEYTKYTDGWVTRLFYLDGETRFEGRVHEYIYHLYGKQIFLNVIANHSGYIYVTKEKLRQHFDRNVNILQEVIKEEPHVLRWQAQMVQEYETVDEWEAMASFCEEQLKKRSKIETFMDRNHFCTLYAGSIIALLNTKRYEESLAMCETAMKDERSTELLKALIYLRKAENYVALEKWDAALIEVGKYLECYHVFNPDEPAIQQQMGTLLVQMTFERYHVSKAYRILTEVVEKTEIAEDEVQRYFQYATRDEVISQIICEYVQEWEEKDEKVYLKLARFCSKMESDFWYVRYCKVVAVDSEERKEVVQKAVEELLDAITNVFFLPDRVYAIVDKYDIKIVKIWESLTVKQWLKQIPQFVNSSDEKHIDKVYSYLRDVYESEDWRVLCLEAAFLEKQVIAGPKENIFDYHELLKNYATIKIVLYQQTIEEGTESISNDVLAADKILQYEEIHTKDKVLALRQLKEAAEYYPVFADGLGVFLHRYAELEMLLERKQNDEMERLRVQVLAQVKGVLENGQVSEAYSILKQLQQMFPGNAEIEQLLLALEKKE